MKSVADGILPITDTFADEMDFCLDCQACETACPAGVKYGALVEAARAHIHQQKRESWLRRAGKRFFLGWLLMKRRRVHAFARVLDWIRRTGIPQALQTSGILETISSRLASFTGLTPPVSPRFSSTVLPNTNAPLRGSVRYKVGFLTGCVMDVSYADVNNDTVEVLRRHGCEVVIPDGQECCGSLHAHNGDLRHADELAKINIEAFDDSSLDCIVMNSAGCGAFMKEYAHRFKGDPQWKERAERVSAKIRDLTEFLYETGFSPSNNPSPALEGKTVSYHDACHLVHTQKVSRQPRELMRSVPGILYRELPESSWCCGSAGIYNIVRHDDSLAFLERKLANIGAIAPDILVTGNPGCMIQIGFGLKRDGRRTEVMHTATFLRHACGAD
ncbi:MAG: glycolate oxidase iron-sulfur subunit [Bacteroidia bacterium]|nr:MAG: glycolate oxidase iron-sulfur subunit [Bacteroidia bacterium]